MKKKLLSTILVLLVALICFLVLPTETQAASETGLTFTLNSDGESYSVTDCNTSASGSLTIPASYNGKPVTSIGPSAFYICYKLTSITIPDGVTSIGSSAFYSSGLTNITIPDSVTSIGGSAFSGCTRLTSITIPDGVTSIGEYAFDGCSCLTGIWVDANNASYSSDSKGVLFNKNKTELIKAPGKLYGSYVIPDNVTSIGDYAFEDCSSLTSVTIGNGVTRIGSSAFKDCSKLMAVTIPNSLKFVGKYAFSGCTELEKVYICDQDAWDAIEFEMGQYCMWVDFCLPDYSSDPTTLKGATLTLHRWIGGDCTTAATCELCGSVAHEVTHTWIDATCTSPKFCFLCGLTEGNYGHVWMNGTCTTAATCSVCGEIQSKAPGHTWTSATCTTPKTCTICGTISGTALGHSWSNYPCTESRTCNTCGLTEAAVGHVWQNATCLAPKTCAICGMTEGSIIGHTYDNNGDAFCNICNHQRTLSDTNLKFYNGRMALSFQDYIGMQNLIQNKDVSQYDKVYVIAVQETPDGLVKTKLEGIPFYGAYQVFDQHIVSWSMTEKVTMTLYGEKDGVIYQGVSITDSVQSLAMKMLKTSTDTLKSRVLVDMLNYGAAVQVKFNHNATNLPNAELGEYAAFGTTSAPDFTATNSITGTAKVRVLHHNISLQAKVEIQMLFEADISVYTAKAMANGKEVPVVIDKETYSTYGWTVLRIAIAATQMRDTHTIALYDANGNPVTQIYNVSAEGYATARLNSDYHDAYTAMMRYSDSVKAFVNS